MYPLPQLNIIAPIIFIVLICLIPLLGLLAGWKRAAFWGGGFLLFYIIGLIVWSIAGISISSKLSALITDLLNKMFPQLQIEEPLPAEFVKSVLTPFYFLVVMIIAWILLMINYYAWYKKVTGLRKVVVVDKKTKKKHKEFSKLNKNHDKKWYKAVYRLGGFAIMGATTFPTTLAFTQFAYVATTTTALRQENKLSNSVYEKLYPLASSGFSKVCYFKEDTLLDYDSLLSVVSMLGKKVDVLGTEVLVTDVITQGIGTGVSNIFASLTAIDGLRYQPDITGTLPEINTEIKSDMIDLSATWDVITSETPGDVGLAPYWNAMFAQYQTETTSFFKSLNVLPAVNKVIKPLIVNIFGSMLPPFSDDSVIPLSLDIEIPLYGPHTVNIELPMFKILFCNDATETITIPDVPVYDNVTLHVKHPALFEMVIQGYKDQVPDNQKVKPIKIPKKNVDNISSVFQSFFSIDSTYKTKLQEEEGITDPESLMNEYIESFLECAILAEEHA